MFRTNWLAIGIVIAFCLPVSAGDVGDVLEQCERASSSACADIEATVERRQGGWNVSTIEIISSHLTEATFSRLIEMAALESLAVDNTASNPAEGIAVLGALPRLRRLELHGDFGDRLRIISGFPHLEEVDLPTVGSGMESDLRRLGTLSTLRRVNVWRLDLSGLSPTDLGPIVSVRELTVQQVISSAGADVAKLRAMTNLRALEDGSLDATMLSALKDLPHLERLHVTVKEPLDLSVLKALKSLAITSSGTLAEIGGTIRLPATLEQLRLNDWTVPAMDFRSAPHVAHVSLFIDWVGRYDEETERHDLPVDLGWLALLSELRELELQDPNDGDLARVAQLTSLQTLKILGGSCPLVSIGDAGMKTIGGMRQLESLRVRNGWEITDDGLAALANLPKLRRLELVDFFPKLSADALSMVGNLRHLRTLDVSMQSPATERPDLSALQRLAELEELSLGGPVTDDELQRLAALKKLRHLDLTRAIGFTRVGLTKLLDSLPALEALKMTVRYAVPEE